MNRILKYGLLTAAAGTSVVLVGIAYLAATFNPNDYKAAIIKAVKESKQRNLRLDGDIKLSFYPSIAASLNKVSLSEFKSDREFASVESARVSLALLPLLHKQVVVSNITVSGLNAVLVKYKNGTTNIDDLLDKTGQKPQQQRQEQGKIARPPVKFDIASISVEKASLNYRDEGSGTEYKINDFNLKTGRVASGVPVKIDLSLGIQAKQPRMDVHAQVKTALAFDLEEQKYQLQGLAFQASGTALDITNLKIAASGNASADIATHEFTAEKFTLNASGIKLKDKFEVTLDAPSLNLANDKYSGGKLTLNAKLDTASGNMAASLVVPGAEGNAQSFKVSALSLDLDLKQPEQAFKVQLSSPLSGNIKAQQFNLSNLNIAVTATGDKLPNKSVNSEMKGSVQVDALKQNVQAYLAGGLLQSQIKAKIGMQGFTNPMIKFDTDVDQFDADLYLPKASASSAAATAPESKEPEQALDFSALRTLNLQGSLRIGTLKVMRIKTTQLRMDMHALHGLVNINPLSAKLYQGSMSGSMSLDVQATPAITIIENLNGIDVAPLMKDAASLDMLEGRGNIGMNLNAHGNTVSAMKKTLGGNLSLHLTNGALKGIDIDKQLRAAQAMLHKGGGASNETRSANKEEKTVFKEFKASFKVANGIAHNDDLSLKSELVRVGGAGDINIGNDSIDYFAQAAIASSPEGKNGITVPLHIKGPYTDLKYTLDYAAMIKEAVKQKVDEKIESKKEELKNQLQEQLKGKLKGLFR